MEYLHKICEIYVTPQSDSEKVLKMLINADILISESWEKDGRFKFEIFEKSPIKWRFYLGLFVCGKDSKRQRKE